MRTKVAAIERRTFAAVAPHQFHGDLPTTTEATYADGSNTSPADWTMYRQFEAAVASSHCGVHRVGTNPPRTDAEPPEPCASTR